MVLVDGDPVPSSELQLHVAEIRAVESVSPSNLSFRLRSAALRSAVRAKVEQQIAREHGLGADITFESFGAQLEAENVRRSRSLASGQPVYGPQRLSTRDLYRYQAATRAHDLKAALAATVLAPTPDELEAAYAQRTAMLHKGYLSRVRVWRVGYRSATGALMSTRDHARTEIERIQAARLNGKTPHPAAFVEVFETQVRSHAGVGIADPTLTRAASMSPGELSDVEDTSTAYELVEVLDRQDLGTETRDQAKGALVQALVDAKYEAYVDEHVRAAHIKLMPAFYVYVPR